MLPSPGTDTAGERALGLTHELPEPYREACQQLMAYGPPGVDACPRVVPAGPLVVLNAGPVATEDGYEDSYVVDLLAHSLGTIEGRPVESNGGHWTISVAWGALTRRLLEDQLHAALGTRPATCRNLRLAGESVEACRVPRTDEGYYSGHVAYGWMRGSIVYNVTIHGFANEPRLALMVTGLIQEQGSTAS
jgi:hypothetical protein